MSDANSSKDTINFPRKDRIRDSRWFKTFDFLHERSIPIDYLREFDDFYRYSFGTVCVIAYLGLFLYFVVSLYLESQSSSFVAVHNANNKCSPVLKPLSGTFMASYDGFWEGSPGYSYVKAPYQYIFRDLTVDYQDFVNNINKIAKSTLLLDDALSVHNLAINLIYWMTARLNFNTGGSIQTAQLTGDPAYVFNRKAFYAGAVAVRGNQSSVCRTSVQTTFDVASSSFRINYATKDFCNETYPPEFITNLFPTSTITIVVDMRSTMTSLGYNIGINNQIGNYYLESFNSQFVEINGELIEYYEVVDNRYVGMSPIYCINKTEAYCGIAIGKAIVLPVLNHWGDRSDFSSKYCDCTNELGRGRSGWCNVFDLTVTFIQIGTISDPSSWISKSIETAKQVGGQFSSLSVYLFDVTKIMLTTGISNDVKVAYIQATLGEGFVMAIRAVDTFNTIISKEGFQLINGSCRHSVINTTDWAKLGEFPPTDLEEPYITCIRNPEVSILDAMGLGMANTDLFIRFLGYLIFPMILLCIRGISQKKVLHPEKRTLSRFVDILHQEKLSHEEKDGQSPTTDASPSTASKNDGLLGLSADDIFKLIAWKVYTHPGNDPSDDRGGAPLVERGRESKEEAPQEYPYHRSATGITRDDPVSPFVYIPSEHPYYRKPTIANQTTGFHISGSRGSSQQMNHQDQMKHQTGTESTTRLHPIATNSTANFTDKDQNGNLHTNTKISSLSSPHQTQSSKNQRILQEISMKMKGPDSENDNKLDEYKPAQHASTVNFEGVLSTIKPNYFY